jgi:4-amino-4-deoxy-L-arabinose transferase-like glycosyltransferase
MPRHTRRPAPSIAEPPPCSPISRREWLALAAIVLLAAALRFAYPGRMAVEHFDEGVYASNIFFGPEDGHRYPYRHLYAPPLLPWLIEWGIVFLGPESIAPFLPSLVLGTVTVPLAWWAARCWFGSASGLAAGLLVATSDFHVLYSRTALTDVPVAFFILLAVYLYWESVRRASLRWAIAAGLATALAWWTKYTGWLPLAIAASGSAAWVLFDRRGGGVSPPSRALLVAKLFATMAVTAIAAWSPVLWDLQPYGGYAAVAENHHGYLEPFAWTTNLWEQAGNLAAQSGALTTIGLAAFAAAVPLRANWPQAVRVPLALWCGVTAGLATFAIGPALPLTVIALVAVAIELTPHRAISAAPESQDADPSHRLAIWLVAAWFIGMLVTTPLYHPYARLAMPWLAAACFAATLWLSRGRPLIEIGGRSIDRAAVFSAAMLILPAALFAAQFHTAPWRTAGGVTPAWEDRTEARRTAEKFAKSIRRDRRPSDLPAVVFVYAKPAVFYYLAATLGSEDTAVVPVGNLSVVTEPPPHVASYLVMSQLTVLEVPPDWYPHLRQLDQFTINAGAGSSLVLLDEGAHPQVTGRRGKPRRSLALYRLVP